MKTNEIERPMWFRHWKLLYSLQVMLAVALAAEGIWGLLVLGPNITVANFPLTGLAIIMAEQLRENAKNYEQRN